jgi:hypothetical protein
MTAEGTVGAPTCYISKPVSEVPLQVLGLEVFLTKCGWNMKHATALACAVTRPTLHGLDPPPIQTHTPHTNTTTPIPNPKNTKNKV